MADNYKIIEDVADVTSIEGKWNIKVKKISWYSGAPKYDIRPWSPDGSKMGKGLTLTDEEYEALKVYFQSLNSTGKEQKNE